MYENYTYEYILNSILDRISSADSTIDLREGSAMWYAVAPVALELAIAYTNYDMIRKESFAGTATREGLYLACEDIGLDTNQFESTASVFLAHFDNDVKLGSRWSCGGYIFDVTSKEGMVMIDGVEYRQYRLTCETLGSHTAHIVGKLKPVTDYGSDDIRVSILDSCIVVGENEKSDAYIRESYFDYIANKSEGGNIAQYRQWLNEYDGVGAHKILPNWNGANTVKVVILDENKEAPTSEFIASVQNYLDPNQEGLGEGKAPIGAIVTVEGGTNVYIDVKATLTLVSPSADISDINTKLDEYFRKTAFQKSVVNIYDVASIILTSPSVIDVNDVQLGKWVDENTEVSYASSNIRLEEFETPVLHQFYNA